MSTQTAEVKTGAGFRKFFTDQLKKILWAEIQWQKMLHKLKKAAANPKLSSALGEYGKDSELKIRSLERIFDFLGEKPKEKRCCAMAGVIREAESIILDTENGSNTRDAGLILAVQKAAHYQIAVYGTLRVFANHMQWSDIRSELEKTLEKEKLKDAVLTAIAEDYINDPASEE